MLEQFTKGLLEAGHTNDVVDLYAIGFNPVLTTRDFVNWLPDENAPDVVQTLLEKQVLASGRSFLQRVVTWCMFRNKSPMEFVTRLRKRGPRDVRQQQAKVAQAQALVFISPVWFVGFPAILKGWIERVFTLGFAFSLTSAGWHGDIGGRLPLLKHQKALIINTTIFNEDAYQTGLGEAMRKLIDEFALQYPGIRKVEHEYFYAVNMANEKILQGYLQRAYQLGKDFAI